MLGEGDLQEGATWEALLFAGHRKLSNLCALIDYNRSQVDGKSDDILSLDPLPDKLRACRWAVREIDGHDLAQILDALDWARGVSDAPAAIVAHTTKGKGVSFMLDRHEWHGKAPNREQALAALAELGETDGRWHMADGWQRLRRKSPIADRESRSRRSSARPSAPNWSSSARRYRTWSCSTPTSPAR